MAGLEGVHCVHCNNVKHYYSFICTGNELRLERESFTFQSGTSQVCMNLTIVEDLLIEPKESFTLTLVENNIDVQFGNKSSTKVTVQDNDCTFPLPS